MAQPTKWDSLWLNIATHVASMSKDPSTKVGCVIVSQDNRKCSVGYNGFPRGANDAHEEFLNKERKYEKVIHAEVNCIINCPFDTVGCKMYITHQPCHRCLANIVNSGITHVYYNVAYTKLGHQDIFKEYAALLKEIKQLDIDKVSL